MSPFFRYAAAVGSVALAAAEPAVFEEPSQDRWIYPSNSTPGSRGQASSFSALPASDGVDDRFGFFLFAFDTAAQIPAGLDPSDYRILAVTVTATIGQDRLFRYDPSADPLESFATPSLPAGVVDSDPGRPVELHGAGFRNGFTAADFTESSPHGPGAPGGRNAYPLGFDPDGIARDVSNNLTDGFDSRPWAIGLADDLEAGDEVPFDTRFRFPVEATAPGTAGYLAEGLAAGRLWFSISSLHPATQQAGEFVSWYTRDDSSHVLFGGLAPTLELEVAIRLPIAITHAPGRVTLQWPALPGMRHTIESTPAPGTSSWEILDHYDAENAGPARIELDAPGPRCFYRIQLEPLP